MKIKLNITPSHLVEDKDEVDYIEIFEKEDNDCFKKYLFVGKIDKYYTEWENIEIKESFLLKFIKKFFINSRVITN